MYGSLTERITRSLAYMLRHQPEEFDLELDSHGYGDLEDVVCALNERLGEPIDSDDVVEAISTGDRPRYEVVGDRIRALYGHSFAVDPGESCEPPDELFVGVGSRDADRARTHGLHGGRRAFLHLARTYEEAQEMGRRAAPEYAVITVHAIDAWEDGIEFYDRKALFLAESIPTEFIEVGEILTDGFRREGRWSGGGSPRSGGRRGGGGGGGRRGGFRGEPREGRWEDDAPRHRDRDDRERPARGRDDRGRDERGREPRPHADQDHDRERGRDRDRDRDRDREPREHHAPARAAAATPPKAREAAAAADVAPKPASTGSSRGGGGAGGFGSGIFEARAAKAASQAAPVPPPAPEPRSEPAPAPPEPEPESVSEDPGFGFGAGL